MPTKETPLGKQSLTQDNFLKAESKSRATEQEDLLTGISKAKQDNEVIYNSGLTPRFQWNANDGYCGETAFISVGLKWGQYVSQWEARKLAWPKEVRKKMRQGDENSKATSKKAPYYQLLLGVNAIEAAKNMHMQAKNIKMPGRKNPLDFLAKIQGQLNRKHDVIIGVFDSLNKDGGDQEYDHIVPILSIKSEHSLSNLSREEIKNNRITISDNGLVSKADPHHTTPWNADYKFSYSYKNFPRTFNQMNKDNAPIYALPKNPDGDYYGVAIKGIKGKRNLLRVELETDKNNEGIHNGKGNAQRMRTKPEPISISLTPSVTIPKKHQGRTHTLFMFKSFDELPAPKDFKKGDKYVAENFNVWRQWSIPASAGKKFTPEVEEPISIWSDQSAIFRAVPSML